MFRCPLAVDPQAPTFAFTKKYNIQKAADRGRVFGASPGERHR